MKALIGVLVLFVAWLIYLDVAALLPALGDENLGFRQRVAWVAAVIVVPVVGQCLLWSRPQSLTPRHVRGHGSCCLFAPAEREKIAKHQFIGNPGKRRRHRR
jgi:hypothetical protein